MKTILVIGPVTRRAGYGEQARFALRSLRAHEDRFNILIQDIAWGQSGQVSEDNEEQRYIRETIAKTQQHLHHKLPVDISLQITIPNEFKRVAPINIGYTAGIEATRVSPQWIQQSTLMDKIILVSNHSKDVYEKTSYEGTNDETGEKVIIKTQVPMEVVNYPVRSLEVDDLGLELRHDFNFLTIAQMGPRKNLANTIKWFLEEFHDDEVGLVVKTNMSNCSTADGQYCLESMKQMTGEFPDRKCSVYLVHGDLSLEQMNSLYTHPKMKAYVTHTHGEGFGIPIFEAAVIQQDAGWCYPKEKSAKDTMRDVYSDYPKYIGMARKLEKHILKNFTEKNKTTQFAEAVLGEKIKEKELDLVHV